MTLELGGHRRRDVPARRPDRRQPGREARSAGAGRGARCRDSGHGRARAGVALAARARDRRHRHEREVDDDDADGTDARAVGVPRAGRREHRRAAERAGGRLDRRHAARRRGQQLPAAGDRHVPPVDRGAAELLAGPPRSARIDRGVRGGESGDLPAAERIGLGGRERRRRAGASGWPRRAARGACATGCRIAGDGFTVADGAIVERPVGERDAAGAGRCGPRAGPPHPQRRRRSGGDQQDGRRRARRDARRGLRLRRPRARDGSRRRPSRACGS